MQKYITDTRYTPLALLEGASGRMRYVDLMNQTCAASGITPLQGKSLLKTMHAQKLISGAFQAGTYVRLEQPGAELLLALRKEALEHSQRVHEAAVQQTQQERHHRSDKNVAIIAALVPLIIFILDLIVSHSAELIEKISALFH